MTILGHTRCPRGSARRALRLASAAALTFAAGCAAPRVNQPVNRAAAAYASLVVDPRAGMKLNSGRELSTTEKIRLFPVLGALVAPVEMRRAARGEIESQFAFEHNLEPLGSENRIGLLAFMADLGMIDLADYRAHLKAVLESPRPTHAAAREALRRRVRWKWADGRPIEHWTDVAGLKFETLKAIIAAGALPERRALAAARAYLRRRMRVDAMYRDVRLAERLGDLPRSRADESLRQLFWLFYRGAVYDRAESNTISLAAFKQEYDKAERNIHRSSVSESAP